MPDEGYDAIVTCVHGRREIQSSDYPDYKLPCGCYFDEDPDFKPVIDKDWIVSMHADAKEWKMDDA